MGTTVDFRRNEGTGGGRKKYLIKKRCPATGGVNVCHSRWGTGNGNYKGRDVSVVQKGYRGGWSRKFASRRERKARNVR